ncbi:hypothetical protein L489_4753, partial [Bordetella bronchiseptica 00-P-2730]
AIRHYLQYRLFEIPAPALFFYYHPNNQSGAAAPCGGRVGRPMVDGKM